MSAILKARRYLLNKIEVYFADTILARNNMRAMTKGDMAFFYHSNCKLPGIVGIMEIVQEHSIDGKCFQADDSNDK